MPAIDLHHRHWPPGVPRLLDLPAGPLFDALADSTARHPDHDALIYHGRRITFAELHRMAEGFAGDLMRRAGLRPEDPVLICLHNSPHFVIAYYGVLRAGGIAVPVNPMSRDAEMAHLIADTAADIAICGAPLWPQIGPALMGGLRHVYAAAYGDLADPDDDLPLPDDLDRPAEADCPGAHSFVRATQAAPPEAPPALRATDPALIVYSSGTTGRPKGCLHTHRSVMATALGGILWNPVPAHTVSLATLPFFHVTGMQAGMNGPILSAHPVVIMSRWDRGLAAALIARHRVTRWRSITTMAIDLLNDPGLADHDLSSLEAIGGGGAMMPQAIAARLKARTGLDYVEGYGLSETMAAAHMNPPRAARPQCLGIPVFDVDARVISVETGAELGPDAPGEIVMRGPQVFAGYWRDAQATRAAFVTLDGQAFFRSGDIGRYDRDGYFYLVDRLKRMINAAGFKVWPAEIEALMAHHPDIAEVCVIGTPDTRRGEAVKAVIVPRAGADPEKTAIIAWCRDRMAAYKCPTQIAFAADLPRSGAGKVLWRALTEAERPT